MSRSSRRSQPLLARLALLGVLGRLVGGVVKWVLPRPPRPPRATSAVLAGGDEVRQQLAGRVVEDGRPGRDRRGPGRRRPCRGAWRRVPLPAGRRLEVVPVVEVAQRRLAGVHPQEDRPAASAVAAVGAAARDVGLLAEGRRTVTAVAGVDPDLDAVEEHRGIVARSGEPCPRRATEVRPRGRRAG